MLGRNLSHYKILDEISRGGMGIVYRAVDMMLEREVAIKVLPPGLVSDPERKRRFVREARAASKLTHPHIAVIHEIDEAEDVTFIVMELILGESLSELLARRALSLPAAIDMAISIAHVLAHAHHKGIVHRDLKPGNIMVTEDGRPKIIDFGLAKLVAPLGGVESEAVTSARADTGTGQVLGTLSYMSPEQARGQQVGPESDIFSFGIVVHEMLAGAHPFQGNSTADTFANLLEGAADRLEPSLTTKLGPEMQTLIDKCLAKEPSDRYPTALEVAADLQHAREHLRAGSQASKRVLSGHLAIPVAMAFILLAIVTAWLVRSSTRDRRAREEALPAILELVERDEYREAYALAEAIENDIPNDPVLIATWPQISQTISVETVPPGADVFIRLYGESDDGWQHLGLTPLEKVRLPLGVFRWRLEKDGFDKTEVARAGGNQTLQMDLRAAGSSPAGMVFVPRGSARPAVRGFSIAQEFETDDYWIDRYEVTNREYKDFVDTGGYEKEAYWRHAFVKEGLSLSWEQAMAELIDTTGRQGPSTWELGDYPDGQDELPVGGVSWYEAAAYAEFRGKSLPTIYHWSRAAFPPSEFYQPLSPDIVPLSNFGDNPAPVGSHPGLGPFGTYDMAGNVREWCSNRAASERWILGGGFRDAEYMFGNQYALPPFDRSPNNGFRNVTYGDETAVAQELTDAIDFRSRQREPVEPISNKVFDAYAGLFSYQPSPLNARVESTEEGSDWRVEKITFDASFADERIMLYLTLPVGTEPPYQTIVIFPGANPFLFSRSSDRLMSGPGRKDYFVKSGRAFALPVYRGTFERGEGLDPLNHAENPRLMIEWNQELRRTIDYLETRHDIDAKRLAYCGLSFGAAEVASVHLALENRFQAAVLVSGGLSPYALPDELEQVHFLPRVNVPVLMLNGRYDYLYPLELAQKPMLELLGTPREHRRHVVFDAGHWPFPRGQMIRESITWLDRYLGPTQ